MPSPLLAAYKRCADNERLCFGIKGEEDCIDTNDCTVLYSSFANSESTGVLGTVEFELYWNRDTTSGDRYVALALSNDNKMGSDTVTECILDASGTPRLAYGWTDGHDGTENIDTDTSIKELGHSFNDGIVYCRWSRVPVFTIKKSEFDLLNSSYHLLLAYGPLKPDGKNIDFHTQKKASSTSVNLQKNDGKNIDFHTQKKASSTSVNLQKNGILKGEPIDILIKLHGLFMIIGWLGCVSIAILIARHYKNSWPDSTLCGVKLWFA
ncbi:unnamed protein product, partial [Oppiella nova]